MKVLAKFEWEQGQRVGNCELHAAGQDTSVTGTGSSVPSTVAAMARFLFVHADDANSELTLDGYKVRFVWVVRKGR